MIRDAIAFIMTSLWWFRWIRTTWTMRHYNSFLAIKFQQWFVQFDSIMLPIAKATLLCSRYITLTRENTTRLIRWYNEFSKANSPGVMYFCLRKCCDYLPWKIKPLRCVADGYPQIFELISKKSWYFPHLYWALLSMFTSSNTLMAAFRMN